MTKAVFLQPIQQVAKKHDKTHNILYPFSVVHVWQKNILHPKVEHICLKEHGGDLLWNQLVIFSI